MFVEKSGRWLFAPGVSFENERIEVPVFPLRLRSSRTGRTERHDLAEAVARVHVGTNVQAVEQIRECKIAYRHRGLCRARVFDRSVIQILIFSCKCLGRKKTFIKIESKRGTC